MSSFYKVIVQCVLLYGSESWELTKYMIGKLNSFHHMYARFITGRHIQQVGEEWIYPNTEETLKQANLLTIQEYLNKRRKTVQNYVLTTNIFQECLNSTRGTSTSWKN
jgi:ribonucleotide reductase beta subunit family protein with ferritin-like domain